MAKITELNSGDNRVMEKMLELYLKKHEEAKDEETKRKCEFLMNLVFDSEFEHANECAKGNNRSIGFAYIIEKFKYYDRCLDFFTYRFANIILDVQAESFIHEDFKSFKEFESSNPNTYLLDIISQKDVDLSDFIKTNINELSVINKYKEKIMKNWNKYESKNEMERLFSQLDTYYDNYGNGCSFTRTEVIIYLCKKNNLILQFEGNYKMEDTSEEELDELIKTNDVEERLSLKKDKDLIYKMDSLIKASINKKIKRLII